MEVGLYIIYGGIFVTVVGMISILISIIFHKDYEKILVVRKNHLRSNTLSSWQDNSEQYDVIVIDDD